VSGFVLLRTDQDYGYVTEDGEPDAYTGDIRKAKRFATREDAEADRCPDNEVIAKVEEG
jgi:hypothetical protein